MINTQQIERKEHIDQLCLKHKSTDNRKKIYVIKEYESNYYKIGVSYDPEIRLHSIQTGNIRRLDIIMESDFLDNAHKIEKAIHSFFEDKHVKGEWFILDTDDLISIYRFFTNL